MIDREIYMYTPETYNPRETTMTETMIIWKTQFWPLGKIYFNIEPMIKLYAGGDSCNDMYDVFFFLYFVIWTLFKESFKWLQIYKHIYYCIYHYLTKITNLKLICGEWINVLPSHFQDIMIFLQNSQFAKQCHVAMHTKNIQSPE